LATEVVLRWKQMQGEGEMYLTALVWYSHDPCIRMHVQELSAVRARLPILYRTGKPTAETQFKIAQEIASEQA
jgi:hypothetical protein